MAATQITAYAAERGEKISISFNAGDGIRDVSLTPIDALALAQALTINARTSMCGPRENPDNSLHPQLVVAGVTLDRVEEALAEVVRQLG